MTAIIHAAWDKYLTPELLKALVSHGADVNAHSNGGVTAMMYAAGWGLLTSELLELFISHGADINAKDKNGCTAIMFADVNSYLTPQLAECFAEQFLRLNTPLEEIHRQVKDYSNATPILVRVMLERSETDIIPVMAFLKKRCKGKLDTWVKNGVVGAEELVGRLVAHLKKERAVETNDTVPLIDF